MTTINTKLLDSEGIFHSNEGLFRDNAPAYWQLGLPVFPLKARSKEASLFKNWNQLAKRLPTPEEQNYWLNNWPDCNIGLPLGPQSGCVAIDIDTDDPKLIETITSVCGPSPWERIGKKGKVLLYKYSGELPFKIKNAEGKMICECLSIGNQVVLPPSIHPDTQKPYTCNVPLTAVYRSLRPLPSDFEERLRESLKEQGVRLSISGHTRVTDFVSQGSRDVKMTSMAGLFAYSVLRGDITLLEAIDRLHAWKESCVESVAGDDIDINKGVQNLIKFLIQDVLGPKHKILPTGWDEGLTQEQKTDWGLTFPENMTAWTVSQFVDYLDLTVNAFDDILKKNGCFEYVLQKMVHSPNLTSSETDIILDKIHKLSDNTLTKGSLKNRLRDLKKSAIEGNNHTDIAEAVIEDLKRVGDVKYWNGFFYQWMGSHWEELPNEQILRTIAKEYGDTPAGKRASDHRGILDVMRSLLKVTELGSTNGNTIGINFANGFLDQNGELLDHSPRFGCTYTLPYRYLPELADKHPKWDGLLTKVWGHCPDFEARVRALREAICITVFGLGTSFAKAVLLQGIGGSGKSQVLDVVRGLLPPEGVSYVSPYEFADKYSITELSKSTLNVCGELYAEMNIPDALFKSVIDGSSHTGQYKYGQLFSFSPRCTHWFASNYLPKSKDASVGFFRRWLILTFDKPIKSEEKIRNFGELVVAEEREGIMAWAAEIIKEVVKQGDYTIPKSHEQVLGTMIGENDTVYFYLNSNEGPRRVKEDQECKTKLNQLYEKYCSFCYATIKIKPLGLRAFLGRINELAILLGFRVEGTEIYGLKV